MQQWNVGVQQQLYARGAIDVGYVGSHGDHLIQPIDINRPQPADVRGRRRQPESGRAVRRLLGRDQRHRRRHQHAQTTACSNYWGILTQFRHDGGARRHLTLNYTLSRNRTNATNDRDSVDFPQDPNNLAADTPTRAPIAGTSSTRPTSIELPFYQRRATAAEGGARRLADVGLHDDPVGPAGLRASRVAPTTASAGCRRTWSAIPGRATDARSRTGSTRLPTRRRPTAPTAIPGARSSGCPGATRPTSRCRRTSIRWHAARPVPRRLHQRLQPHAVDDGRQRLPDQSDVVLRQRRHLRPDHRDPKPA